MDHGVMMWTITGVGWSKVIPLRTAGDMCIPEIRGRRIQIMCVLTLRDKNGKKRILSVVRDLQGA